MAAEVEEKTEEPPTVDKNYRAVIFTYLCYMTATIFEMRKLTENEMQ